MVDQLAFPIILETPTSHRIQNLSIPWISVYFPPNLFGRSDQSRFTAESPTLFGSRIEDKRTTVS